MEKIGEPLRLIEKRGNIELYCYGSPRFPAWAIFIHEGKEDPKIINGKWEIVWPEYLRLTQS